MSFRDFLFGPEANAPDKRKAPAAEAGTPKVVSMLQSNQSAYAPQRPQAEVREEQRRVLEIERTELWLEDRLARAASGMDFSETVTITPILASLILQRNPDNRRIRMRRLQEISADLQNNNWVYNGESIIISKDGLLNDGQHRLMAIRDTGKSARSVIVFGVDRRARLTTDQGTARTAADYLDMGGDSEDALIVAAVSRFVWMYERHGTVSVRGAGSTSKELRGPTKAEVLNLVVERREAFLRSIAQTKKSTKAIGSRSLVAASHYILSKRDQGAADHFIGALIEGANLDNDNPIFILRSRLVNTPTMTTADRFEAIIRAWNAYRQRRPLQKIQIMGRLPKVEA